MTTPALRRLDNPEAERHFRAAQALFDRGADDAAIPHVFRAITLEPDLAMARLLLGEILLRRGEYRAGWLEYEWGSRLGIAGEVTIRAPQWNGMRLGAGSLILIGSQGFGDVIQFASSRSRPSAARASRWRAARSSRPSSAPCRACRASSHAGTRRHPSRPTRP